MSSTVAHTFQAKQRTGDVLISENVDFKGLLLSERVLKGLKSAGFERPSPIQLKAIPLGRCGLDLIVQAKSGTGKTCVFSVIALENLQLDSTAFQAIVLAPTREIAVQIWDVINSIGQAIPSLKCHTFIGGMPLHEDRQKLKRCHIGVGTPGRIKQLIETGIMNVESVRMFILDEADKLLEESFQEQINWIYSTLPDNKQMLALSATYPEYLAQHLTAYMRNPTFLRLNITDPALLGIKQYFKMVPYHPMPNKVFEDKVKVVVELLSSVNFQQCLIFSNLQTRAHNMADTLTSMGWPTACIAGSHDQKDRNEAMAKLKTYKCRVLISTDLTSRGIDADKVNMVLNLDVPKDHETYLHRIGRAGRFGSFGAAITIISIGQEQTDLQAVEKKCNTHINPLPGVVPSDLCKSDVQIHLDDMVSSEQIITNGATQDSLLLGVKTTNTPSPPTANIELNGTSTHGNNSDLCMEDTGKKKEEIQANGKLFEQVLDNSVVVGDNPENGMVLDKSENDSNNGKKSKSIKNRSSYRPSKSDILSENGHSSSNNEDGLTTVEQVDDKPRNTPLKQFPVTFKFGPKSGLEAKVNCSHNNCNSLVSEREADEGSVINDIHENVKSNKSSARNIDVTPSGTTSVKKSPSGANKSVYSGMNGSLVYDDNSEIASHGQKLPAHVYSSHSSIFDSNKKIPFSVKIPTFTEVISHQKVQNPHTFENAVQEFQEQNVTKNNITEMKNKILRPVDTSKIQRKEVFTEISTFLQQVSENENARYHFLNLKNTHLEKKKKETAGNESSGQKLRTFEQIWEKLGDVPENANFTAVKVVPIKLSNEQKTASSVNNNPLFECSIRTGQISCKASNKESKVISENIPSNMALHMAKDLEGNCEEKENDIFGMSKSMFNFWDQLGENVESTEDKTSSSVSDFESKNGQLVCKNIKIAQENSNNNNKMVDTVRIGDDKENSDRKPNLGPSKSNQRKRYRPLSLGAFCNNMRENNKQSDSFSTQVQELACSKSASDSVQLDKVNDIKLLDDPDDNFKHLVYSDDDTSESILSSSCSEFSDSEDLSSTSDEEEDCLDKHAHTSEGRSQNNHMKSQSRHNRTTPSPVFNYQHGYDPYWYGCAQPHYGWLPWYSYQNPYYYPAHLSRQQQYSKLQENLDTQSEYITLMLKK